MASNPCFAAFAAAEEIPILHYYGVEVFTMAKRILISALLLKGNKVDVEEFLKDTFPRKQQIILSPYRGGQSFSLNDVSYQELEDLSILKPSCEPHAIVGPHNEDEYNIHRLAYVNAAPDEKSTSLDLLRNFIHNAVLENLSSSIHKEFASYHHPIENQRLLLLGNRKVYSTNKSKIQKFELQKKKDDAAAKKSEARAALPSISSKNPAKDKPTPPASSNSLNDSAAKSIVQSPPAAKEVPKSNSETKRRSVKEINYKEDSGNSTSSVEYPVEGKHTDDESEGEKSGSRTPIFFNPSQQATIPTFMTEPGAAMQISGGPLNFHARIPKPRRKTSKHFRRSPSAEDSKPSSTRERKRLEKKSSKHAKKSSKKSSRRSRKYSTSSSSSSSNSDADSVPSEQVSSPPPPFTIHNLIIYYLLLPISPGKS